MRGYSAHSFFFIFVTGSESTGPSHNNAKMVPCGGQLERPSEGSRVGGGMHETERPHNVLFALFGSELIPTSCLLFGSVKCIVLNYMYGRLRTRLSGQKH